MNPGLPSGWANAALSDVANVVRGVAFPKEAKTNAPADGLVACLRTTNVQREVDWDDLWYIPARYVRADQYLDAGDILISTANSLELVGKVALVRSLRERATLGAFISAIRGSGVVSPHFLYYQLSAPTARSAIRSTASTTTNISNISTKKLGDVRFLVAPRPEQDRIVAEIEKQFTRLDAAVAALKRVQANLKRYRAAVLKAACEGRLLPTEAELARREGRSYVTGAECLERVLAERRKSWETLVRRTSSAARTRYVEPPAPNAAFELPSGWAWATVEQLNEFARPCAYGVLQPGDDIPGGVPLIRVGDINNGRVALVC